MGVDEIEYKNHKKACSLSFKEINDRLEKIDRALFGEEDLGRIGVYQMTQELYESMKFAKGGQRVFWASVKIAGGISVIIGTFWSIVSILKGLK